MRILRLLLFLAVLLSQHAGLAELVVEDPCCGGEERTTCDEDCPPTCVLRACCAERSVATPPADLPRIAAARPTSAHLPEVERLSAAEPADIFHVPKPSCS
jgi:hypothetical protein